MALQQLNNYAKFFSFILKYYNSDVVKSTANSVLNEIEKTEISEDEYNQKPEELVEDLKKMGPDLCKIRSASFNKTGFASGKLSSSVGKSTG